MKRSKLKYNYIQYFGDDRPGKFSGMSTAQYRTLKLDYAFSSETYNFIRDEKE